MAQTFAAVSLGNTHRVHAGVKYSDTSPWRTRCASGRGRACEQTDEPITCIRCLTRYSEAAPTAAVDLMAELRASLERARARRDRQHHPEI